MNMQELKQLIELHDAFDKHEPMGESPVFGSYLYDISICKSCGMPLRINKDTKASTPMDYGTIASLILLRDQHRPIFTEFLRLVHDRDMRQAWVDLCLSEASEFSDYDELWSMIKHFGTLPSEDMLAKRLDTNMPAAVTACRYLPELQTRVYRLLLGSKDIQAMYDYCARVTNHTDRALLDAAEAVAAVAPKERTLDVPRYERAVIDRFNDWHCQHLVWEQRKIKQEAK